MKEPLRDVVKRLEEIIEAQKLEVRSLAKTLAERDQLLDDQRNILEALGKAEKALKEVVAVEKAREDGRLKEAEKTVEAQAAAIQSLNETVEDLRNRVKMLVGG